MFLTSLERMIAFRYLRSRRQEGFISVVAWFSLVGIALGVATLIVVMSVMNGFRKELIGKILGVNGHITLYGPSMGIPAFGPLTDELSRLTGVTVVTPLIEGQVMATANNLTSGALVKGMRKEDLADKKVVGENLQGSLDRFAGKDVILIGKRLADKMNLDVGDSITLISPKGFNTIMGMVPRVKAYEIVGLFEVGMFEYDSGTVIMPLEAAQTYFQLTDKVSAIELKLADPTQSMAMVDELNNRFKGQLKIYDWQQANAQFMTALQVERNVMFLILTLIIVVAAFNIISSMIMLVKDKTRDIAILRTMGLSRGGILRVFFVTGATIGIVGTLSGFLLGLSFALNIESIRQGLQKLTGTELFSAEIYYLTQLPADVHSTQVVSIVIMALVLTFLATIYPAWKAAKTDPAEVLRYG